MTSISRAIVFLGVVRIFQNNQTKLSNYDSKLDIKHKKVKT